MKHPEELFAYSQEKVAFSIHHIAKATEELLSRGLYPAPQLN